MEVGLFSLLARLICASARSWQLNHTWTCEFVTLLNSTVGLRRKHYLHDFKVWYSPEINFSYWLLCLMNKSDRKSHSNAKRASSFSKLKFVQQITTDHHSSLGHDAEYFLPHYCLSRENFSESWQNVIVWLRFKPPHLDLPVISGSSVRFLFICCSSLYRWLISS